MSKSGWLIGLLVVGAGVGAATFFARNGSSAPKFRKEKIERGDVVATVTAAGSLSAVTTVKVGSQVSGIIAKLYVDFNSQVKKGQLLAELDPAPFQAAVEQRRADLEKSKVELRSAELIFVRNKSLTEQQLVSRADFDVAESNRDAAKASVQQAVAALKQAETNLAYAKIESPIEGVVVDRQYDIGQTVAASFQAPTLFTIAQDLTKMQVLTNIDESDIGRVKLGQEAKFTVDAFAERNFRGAVSQIRLSSQVVQNVVTYPVMLDVSNPDLLLKPGMTANVQIPVDVRNGVLRIPNAALRFRPAPADVLGGVKDAKDKPAPKAAASPTAVAGNETAAPEATGTATARPEAGARSAGGGRPKREGSQGGEVYVEVADGKLKPAKVKTSITDGNVTAAESDELKEGDEVVVGLATLKAGDTSTARPPGGGGAGRGPRM
jgi:HlyD family secretion protein